jgi:hypothetical protein
MTYSPIVANPKYIVDPNSPAPRSFRSDPFSDDLVAKLALLFGLSLRLGRLDLCAGVSWGS